MQVGVCAALRLCAPTWGISLKDLLDSKSFKLEAVPQSVSASFIPSPFSAFNKCVAFVKTPRVPCACALRQGSKYEAHFFQHRIRCRFVWESILVRVCVIPPGRANLQQFVPLCFGQCSSPCICSSSRKTCKRALNVTVLKVHVYLHRLRNFIGVMPDVFRNTSMKWDGPENPHWYAISSTLKDVVSRSPLAASMRRRRTYLCGVVP